MARRGWPRLRSAKTGNTALAQLGAADQFDVCIVGSGIAGAILGNSLAEAGLRTLILESVFHPKSAQQARIASLDVYEGSGSSSTRWCHPVAPAQANWRKRAP